MYTEEQLISFGHYLLSEDRESSLRETNNVNPKALPYEERMRWVHDADMCNWKHLQGQGVEPQVMWRCVSDLVMIDGAKETAFVEGHIYAQTEKFNKAIALINEQGHLHIISGEGFRYFEVMKDDI